MRFKQKEPESLKHIIDVKAIFDQGRKRYYMFPWADGGNLWELFENRGVIQRGEEGRFIAGIFAQLLGLAKALSVLHQNSYRHGDLKPENILVFQRQNQPAIWKIADFGLAKFHRDPTEKRFGPTSTRHGTFSYEPPEFLQNHQPTSRLYDIWSMGCIILQLITWLLYDLAGVDELVRRTRNPHQAGSTFWNQKYSLVGWSGKVVHEGVRSHMKKIMKDATVSGAIKDLVQVVRDKLLVVRIPNDYDKQWKQGYRTNADTLHDELREISRRGEHDPKYWFNGGTLFRSPPNAIPLATSSLGRGQNVVSFFFFSSLISDPKTTHFQLSYLVSISMLDGFRSTNTVIRNEKH